MKAQQANETKGSSPSEIRPSLQPDNSQTFGGREHQPDTRNLRAENHASPSGGNSAVTPVAGQERLKRNGATTTTAASATTPVSAHKRITGNTSPEIQTATVQQPAAQNTRLTVNPRQSERSGAPAISKSVAPAPAVANVRERSGQVSPTVETAGQNTATRQPAVSAASGTQRTAAKAAESIKTQSIIPVATTAVSTPDARHDSGVQEANTSSGDQTTAPVSDGEAGRSATAADVTTSKEKPGTAASALNETIPTIAPRQPEASPKKDQPTAKDQSTTTPSTSDSVLRTSLPRSIIGAEHGLSTEPGQVTEKQTPREDTTNVSDIVKKDTTSQADKQADRPTKENKPPIRSRWSAALVIAPDFSSTGFGGEMSAPGQAFGGLIGFRISRKFTVVGGVIRSTKKYEGYGKDYTPPEGYWKKRTNGIVPDEVKGSCTIVEVPITVQYDVWQSTRSRLYISGGISSYFMRKEKYNYSFNEPNEGADRSWSSNTPGSYVFKVGHFSAAYEIMLNKNLGVGVEPYIKIPFQGIGWPNISLYTTGAYVNVRYFLLRKNVE